jgi:site-specific DNA-methyltransferase (adenine-specific)
MSELPINQIICGDCLEVMKDWPDGCVDLVLTDPPYGIGEDGQKKRTNKARPCYEVRRITPKYENIFQDNRIAKTYFELMFRLSQNQIIFGGNYYATFLPPSMGWIFWDKMFEKQDFSDGELAFTSFARALQKYRISSKAGTRGGIDRVHPTQKPLQLMEWIVKDFSQPTHIICDPFCGSGTTCVAAKKLGRRYIGIDISPEYCDIARKRLEAVDTGVPVKEAKKGQMPLW